MKIANKLLTVLACGLFSSSLWANTPATSNAEPSAVVATQQLAHPHSVNINLATAAEIQDKLVGIGAKKAQAIVEYREKHGHFLNIEQLTEVSGIGKATLDKNRERIVLE